MRVTPHFSVYVRVVTAMIRYPLLYRCGICGSTREFESVADQARRPLPKKCNGHEARWTQVDVVYAHWSGDIEPLSKLERRDATDLQRD